MELKTPARLAVRPMGLDDMPDVLAIQAACYTAIRPESRTSLHAKLAASPSTCFVATCAGDTVAYLFALPWEFSNPPPLDAPSCRLPPEPDCLYLHDLAVWPAARSAGAGRALVETMLHRFRELGLGRACLIAIQDSGPYWERYGFRAVPAAGSLRARLSTYGEGVQYMALARAGDDAGSARA